MRIEKLIVGMDFSSAAIAGAKWAMQVLAPRAEPILVHVIDLPSPPRFARAGVPSPEEIETAARDYATTRFRDVTSLLSASAIRTEIRVGQAHEVLAQFADDTGADLLVIGPHGDRPRPWKRLGTTAERLVRIARVPVLVAIGEPSAPPRRLLVAIEDTDDAVVTPAILRWARHLAEFFDADLTLLSVLGNLEHAGMASAVHTTATSDVEARRAIRAELEAEGLRWLREVAKTEIGRDRVSVAITFGNPGDAIVAMAASGGHDLIVLGRRTSQTVMPAFLGRTVATTLHGANCPVLVVVEPTDAGSETW